MRREAGGPFRKQEADGAVVTIEHDTDVYHGRLDEGGRGS
jgi:hypothetical protein